MNDLRDPRLLKVVRLGINTGVLGLGITAILVFLMAFARIGAVAREVMAGNVGFRQELELIGIIDILLLGIGILIIATGIVSLMIRPMQLPTGLRFHDLHGLKSTFSSFLILIMAILYLESLASLRDLERSTHSNPVALLYAGVGFLAVTVGLILFQRSGSHQPLPPSDSGHPTP